MPTDVAAAAIVDMRTSHSPFVHLAHPKPVPFTTVMEPIAESLGVPIVPYAEWLAKLEKVLEDSSASAVEAARENPALRLVDFYRVAGTGDDPQKEAFSGTRLEIKEAARASRTLGDPGLPTLGSADANRWMSYWKQIGVLKE